ncbi:hypothetical protein JMJ56_14115 [Belnapia sp. T18]|uniref:Uncharacterized protein n=1 Tax=Belnapia arida TaxID=2804533 RepID=A0ABS1U5F0_9PROT|nr:hypothetical protein [Belnapia arida]MBL6079149.1 hypothetical protein [Belnapia arida]
MDRRAPPRSSLYRAHRLVARGAAPQGWTVSIHPPGGQPRAVLRNTVPAGLAILIEEAKHQVDRRLDGPEWQREP